MINIKDKFKLYLIKEKAIKCYEYNSSLFPLLPLLTFRCCGPVFNFIILLSNFVPVGRSLNNNR